MPIALFCGTKDKLSSEIDYKWLRDRLIEQHSCIYFKEFELGHLAMLMPADKRHLLEMLELVKKANPDYQPNKSSQG